VDLTIFEDIIINPETARVDCFRYTNIDNQPAEFTVIEQDGKPYFLKGQAESQFYHHIELTVEGITNIPWEHRAEVIKGAFTKPLVIKCADGYPYSVVTTGYTTVRHKVAWGWAQDLLNQNMLAAELKGTLSTERKLFARFHTYKDYSRTRYSTPNNGFYIMNSVRNTGSLSFGQSIFLPEREVYLTGPRLHSIAHNGGIDRIESEFKSVFLSFFFDFKLPDWDSLKSHPQQGLTPKVAEMIRKYKLAVLRRLKPEHNMLDYVTFIAEVAQAAPARTRLVIENIAYQEAFTVLN
jgi:hypothetical protein